MTAIDRSRLPEADPDALKLCTKCKEPVMATYFNRDGYGWRSECKWCESQYKQALMATEKGRSDKRRRDRERAKRLRAMVKAYRASLKAGAT